MTIPRLTSGVPPASVRAVNPITTLPPKQKAIGWLGPVGIALLAFGLRVWHLGTPRVFAFDETYYAKDAWSLLNNGWIENYKSDADGHPKTDINADILAGHLHGLWTGTPSMPVHPDVGKWMIAIGEHFWGMNPFGWRISAAVVGSLMVLVMARMVRRMTGSTVLGCLAGVLLAFDGLEFVLSRLALLDIFVAFWLLCAIASLVADRDWHRSRLSRERRVWFRPWLLAAGACFGLSCGSKWDAIYPLGAFGLLCVVWSIGARRSLRLPGPWLRGVLVDGMSAFLHLVLVALIVYIASWSGWLAHARIYEEDMSSSQYRQYTGHGHCTKDHDYVATKLDTSKKWPTALKPGERRPGGLAGFERSLRSLWYYHQDVFTFHTHFLNCAVHPYASTPLSWPLLGRPVGVAVTNYKPGQDGCDAPAGSSCIRQVLLLGNPVIWWGGCLALIAAVVLWLGARDWRYGVAVIGTLSTWLPWLQYDDRPIFIFYAITTLPFVVLALTLVIGRMIGPSREPTPRRITGIVVGGAFVVLSLLSFAWFWPIYTDRLLTHSQWLARMWFSRWI